MSLWSRLSNVFRTDRIDRDLDDEIHFHIEERARELMAEGRSRDEAVRQAERKFGNRLQLREQSRDVKMLPWLDSAITDASLGVRMMRKNAVATATTLVSLSLALGACAAAFSLLDALVFRPLPVRQPDQLVYLSFPTYVPERPESETFNDPTFVRLRDAGREYVDLFAMSTQVIRTAQFEGATGAREPIRTQHVSGDAFERLGVVPAAGRLIGSHDDGQPGASPVAVISHAFWMGRFGGDPGAIGRSFLLQERLYDIVGIAEPRFNGIEPGRPTDVWLPYAMYDPRAFGNAGFNWFRVMGRLKNGAEPHQAQSVLQVAFSAFRRDVVSGLGPDRSPEREKEFLGTPLHVRTAATGVSPLRRQFERPLWILAAIAGLVLLVAGSNVANLSLARAAAREHEMALRLSIGAGRGRLIQQVLIESALVAVAASALAFCLGAVAAPAVVAMLSPSNDPVTLDLRMDWRLASFAGGLVVIATALFGLAPAVRASGVTPIAALKGTRTGGGHRTRAMRPLIAFQVAFGVIVLLVGGLLVQSFARLSTVPPGFTASNVLLLSLETVERVDLERRRAALLGVLDHLGRIPSVVAVSSAEYNLIGRAWTHNVRVPGTAHDTFETTMTPVTHGFFETMMIPLVAGRTYSRHDVDRNAPATIIVNESFARRYYGSETAVGQVFEETFFDDGAAVQHEIIGVVADTKYDLRQPAAPMLYLPMPFRSAGTLHVRVSENPTTIAPQLIEEVKTAGPLFRVTSARRQSAVIEGTMLRERLLALLSAFFATVGLVLAAVGLYGVLSYSVVQRTAEIGLRMALGARQASVIATVLTDTAKAVAAGAAGGLAAGLFFARFVENLLFEVKPLDTWSLGLPLGALLLVAVAAATVPAKRAAQIDPVIALRYE